MRTQHTCLLIVVAAQLYGQGLPSVTGIVEHTGSSYTLTIKNASTVPMTAHVIVATLVRSGQHRDSVSIYDAELEPPISSAGKYIAVGQTAQYPFFPRLKPGEAFYPRVVAAIFSDGTTEGEDRYVKRLLQRRRLVYDDMTTAETKLARFLTAGTSITDVIAELSQAELVRKMAATNIDQEMDAGLVSETIISVLKNTRLTSTNALAEPTVRIQMALAHAKAVRTRLAISKPNLLNP